MAIPTGPSLFEQTLATARFEDIEFPYVTPMRVKGGHSHVPHRAYRRRGADQEPTGQKEYELPIRAALLNDLFDSPRTLYPDTYEQLVTALEDHPIGQLWHPSKGLVTVAVGDWTEEWDADVQNGLYLDIEFFEHNATAAGITADGSSLQTSSDSAAAQQATNADTAAASISTTGALSGVLGYLAMAPLVTTMLTALGAANLTQNQVLGATGPVLSAIATNLGLPATNSVFASALTQALEGLRVTVYAIQSRLASPIATQNYTVLQDASVWQIAQLATGDLGNASLISAFNVIPNPSLVRAGTVLRVPVLTA